MSGRAYPASRSSSSVQTNDQKLAQDTQALRIMRKVVYLIHLYPVMLMKTDGQRLGLESRIPWPTT